MSNLKYRILFHKTLRFEIFDFRLCSSSLFFCFSVLIIFPLNAREVELKVQDVTLYESSAGVLRSGKINLEPGINELMIRNLPVALQDESLVASVETAGASVVGSSTWIETGVVIHNKDVLELQKKIRVLEREIEDYESRNSNLGNLRRILVDTRSKLTEMISKNLFYKKNEVDAKKWFQTLSGNRQAIQVVLSSDQEVGRTIKDLRKKLSELQDKLSVILSLSEKSSRITKILVSFTEAEKKEVKLNLTYRTGGVSWKPFYSVRMDGREKIEFEYLAEINQESGEDWNNINLLLSTSSPDISGRRPRLFSQRVYDQKRKRIRTGLSLFKAKVLRKNLILYRKWNLPKPELIPQPEIAKNREAGFYSVTQSRLLFFLGKSPKSCPWYLSRRTPHLRLYMFPL